MRFGAIQGLNRSGIATAVGIVAATVVAIFAAILFVSAEKEREMQAWQVRLGLVADTRVADLQSWLDGNFKVLREISENASVQLYMTELEGAAGDPRQVTDSLAQAGYLRNLLTAIANRSGFVPPVAPAEVAANVERVAVAGLALTDSKGDLVASSPGMPPMSAPLAAALLEAAKGQPSLIDIHLAPNGEPVIGFAMPLHAVQGDRTQTVGAVLGVRALGKEFYERLKQPGEVSQTAESYLIRGPGTSIEFLTPLLDGTQPLKRALARSTPDLAEAVALSKTGDFVLARDYAGQEVLSLSRAVPGTPWILMRNVSRAEALGPAETRLRVMLAVLILISVGVALAVVAVWRHGASVRASEASERHRLAAERFENLIRFSRRLTDSQRDHILCTGAAGLITFANRPLADAYGIPIQDIKNKPLAGVLGPIKAKLVADATKRVIESGIAETHVNRFEAEDGSVQVVSTDHVYVPEDGTHPPAALTIFHDVTDLTRERERSSLRMQQLVNTLVGVVDRRDPYSAHHSSRVAEVSGAIAQEMGLSEVERETVSLAGRLMNLGKITVSPDLLGKTQNLSPMEKELLAHTFVVSAEMLKGVEFEGPVVETIRQIGEFVDGSGPLKLSGAAILTTAQIVSVSNMFVGMVSPRAWRQAMTFEAAAESLQAQIGKRFDRRPVSALINILDNRDGANKWSHFRDANAED